MRCRERGEGERSAGPAWHAAVHGGHWSGCNAARKLGKRRAGGVRRLAGPPLVASVSKKPLDTVSSGQLSSRMMGVGGCSRRAAAGRAGVRGGALSIDWKSGRPGGLPEAPNAPPRQTGNGTDGVFYVRRSLKRQLSC